MKADRTTLVIAGLAVAVAAAAGIGLVWTGGTGKPEAVEIALVPEDRAVVGRGRRLYREHCASCHGAALEGQADWRARRADGRLPAPPHDETGHTWHHPGPVLFALTKFGPAALARGEYQSDMPAYRDVLSDADIIAVLSYIKSRWPPRIRERHDQIESRVR